MTTIPRALEMLNGINYTVQPFLNHWRDIYYRTSIHTTGACPRFYPLRENGTLAIVNGYTYPPGWLHERYDWVFDTFLLNRHPREPEVTRQWRKSVYRPYQTAPLQECITSSSACIFGDSKYTLTVEDKEDNDYIWGNNFEGKTLVGYFEWMFKAICEDPNSLFVVIPQEPGYNTTSKKVEPTIKHIPTRDIVWVDSNEIVYLEYDTPYAWYVNEMGIFRFEKQGGTYQLMDGNYGYYAHLLTYRPAHFAGGIWNTHRYYDSYLKSAQAFCDDFVAAHSDVQMINKEACHPFIQAVSSDCPSCRGEKQIQYCNNCSSKATQCKCENAYNNGYWELVDCNRCHGTGEKQSHNPADWYLVPKENADIDMVKIIPFDISANKHLDETRDKALLGIKKALYQQHIEEAQSGVAKDIDRSAQYLYRSMVSNGVWNLIEKCLIDILSIRNTATIDGKRKPDAPKYILVKPTDFDLKTEQDLLLEYKESTAANTPEYVRQRQVEQYVDKIFGGDAVMKRKASLINQMDAYSVTSITDKVALLSANGITPEDFQFSNNLPKMLDEVVRNKGSEWFINAEYDDIKAEVDILFAKVPLLKVVDKTATDIKVAA